MLLSWNVLIFYAFVAVTAVQLFYYLFFFSRVAFYKKKQKQQSQQHPVSVVICARDEYYNIEKNLPLILEQNYQTTNEVIVVNDNSQDESKYILGDLQRAFRQLQIVDLTQEGKLISGKKFPLSIGIKEAKNEIVLLTDADCAPSSENWLYKMQDAFTDGVEVVLGYGAYNKAPGFLNKLIRFETFHTALQYFGYALAGKPYMGVGRNLAYRKSLFIQNKGFSSMNHIPSGDDDLFINKVATKKNTAVVLDNEAFTYSVPKRKWREWIIQKSRHYTTSKYYKGSHKFLLGLYSLSFFFFYPLFAAALLFYNWQWALISFGARFLIQAIVWFKAMDRLGERDLFSAFLFWDIGLFFYYIIFVPALWKRPRRTWK